MTTNVVWRRTALALLFTSILALIASVASAACVDSVLVFGPKKYTKTGAGTGTTIYDEEPLFSAIPDSIRGWRYIVQIDKVSSNPTSCKFILDDREWVGSGEGTVLKTVITPELQTDHNASVWITGPSGSNFWLKIMRVREPAYPIYGPQTFVRPTVIAQQTDTFTVAPSEKSPYTLRVYNGDSLGTNRVTNATLHINATQILSASDFGTGIATITRTVSLAATDTIKIYNQSGSSTRLTVTVTATDSTAPALTVSAPADSFITAAAGVRVTGAVGDETQGWVRVNSRMPFATPTVSFTDSVPLTYGWHTFAIQAINGACLTSTIARVVAKDTLAPTLTVTWPTSGSLTTDSTSVTVQGSWSDLTRTAVTVDGDTVALGTGGNFSRDYPLDLGPNRIFIRALDQAGNRSEITRFVFRQPANEPTPRDSSNASLGVSLLSATSGTPFLESVRFLYTGGSPVQIGVDTTKLDPLRASVVRGKVVSRDFGPLANDTVRVLGFPEYGLTVTRSDGRFDMVVNGGTQLTLRFSKQGYLEAQRTVDPGWNTYVLVDSVSMIGKTVHKTVVDLDNPAMVRSRFKTDANGDRDVRLLFTAGTRAKVVRAVGDTVSLSSIRYVRVRASEYTVGTNGATTMPAALPGGSAYTYCVDLSLDEADSLRIPNQPEPNVIFTQPLRCYVRNFLGFPVGAPIPVGYYDRLTQKWVATEDGVVIRILGTAGGTATIDSDGDGQSDSQTRLDALSITTAERTALAHEYRANDQLWRSLTTHFSPKDDNVNLALVAAQQSATAGKAGQPEGILPDPTECPGCIVEAENRVLGERIPIVGTPFSLNYRSYRAPGDQAIRTLRLPVSGDTVPTGVQRILVRLDVAGQRLTQEFSGTLTNRVAVIAWDGKDAFGRPLQGSVEATVSIGFQYGVNYVRGGGGRSLGDQASSGAWLGPAAADRSIGNIAWTRRKVSLGAPSPASAGLGGWTISPHHYYDINGRGTLYFGDGRVTANERNYPVINTFAQLPGDVLEDAVDVAYGPDGSVYIASVWAIYRLQNGQLTRIAGKTIAGTYTDGVLGTDTYLRQPRQLSVGPDGSVYFIMSTELSCNCQRVIRIGTDGYVRSIAGNGLRNWGSALGDGGLAVNAGFRVPHAIAVGPDGSVFVYDREDHTIRRIAPNGYINRYAGTGVLAASGALGDSSGRATERRIGGVNALSTDAYGNLYLAEHTHQRLRKITPDGMMTTIRRFDYINALPNDITVAPDGALYTVTGSSYEQNVGRIYRLDPETGWAESIVAGGANAGAAYSADGIPALGCNLGWQRGMDIAPNGDIYVAGDVVKKIAPPIMASSVGEYSVPSADASEIYVFDLRGRHLRTKDAITGAERFRFTYDGNGQLSRVYDVVGDSTVITRSGSTITVTAPFGQQTTLTLTNGFLVSVTNPNNKTITLNAGTDGLLRQYTDANNHAHAYVYGSDGRLTQVDDPAGGRQTYTLSYSANGLKRTVQRQTLEGRTSTFAVTDLFDGTRQRRITDAAGFLTYGSDSGDAKRRSWSDLGRMTVTDSLAREGRFGFLAPMVRRSTERLPSDKARVIESDRTYSSGFNPPTTGGTFTSSVATNSRTPDILAYNTATRALISTSSAGRTTRVMLDALGRPVSYVVPGMDSVVVGYGPRDRIELIQQGARGVRYGYDALGRLATIRDTLQHMSTLGYDNADRVVSSILPGGRTIGFGYDNTGNLTSLTPPGRPQHGFGYTPIDLTSSYTPPTVPGVSAPATSFEYNKDRQLRKVTRPDGGVVLLHYDSGARLDSVTTVRGQSQLTYSGSHGQLATLSSPDTITLTYGYDGPLVTSEQWSGAIPGGAALTVAHTYNRDFIDSTQTVGGGSAVTFTHDDDGLLTGAGSLAIHRRSDNGLVDSSQVGTIIRGADYNFAGELANLRYRVSGGSVLFQQSLARDDLGRITGIAETAFGTSRTIGYRYDQAGRLYAVKVGSDTVARYFYDANNNRTAWDNGTLAPADTATALYDDQDRLLRHHATRYEWTAPGELRRKFTPATADTTEYWYDALGNLNKVRFDSGDTVTFSADGANRRVGRRLNGSWSRGWLYQDGLHVIAELDGSGAVLNRYVYGEEAHVPALLLRGGENYRMVTDHLGSVRGVVKASDGTVAQQRTYDAWGVIESESAGSFQRLGYAGGLTDSASGLIRFGARDYEPRIGRWILKDPIGFESGDQNVYAYVGGAPTVYVDPTGLFQHYKKWGGPEWNNGRPGTKETGSYPYLPSHPGFVRPDDARDELYRQHDVDLVHCARIADPIERRKCRREADIDLASKAWRFRKTNPCDPKWWTRMIEVGLFAQPWSPNSKEGEYVPDETGRGRE